jgi:transcriptional regulator of acetoin/glycerol metabolism
MVTMSQPQFVSLSEDTLLRALTTGQRRPNLLVVCNDVEVEAVVSHLLTFCAPPYHVCALPGRVELPLEKSGTLLLTDIETLNLGQQMALFDWLSEAGQRVQVVSISSIPLVPLVEQGHFLEGLYYRLNVVHLDATRKRGPIDLVH